VGCAWSVRSREPACGDRFLRVERDSYARLMRNWNGAGELDDSDSLQSQLSEVLNGAKR